MFTRLVWKNSVVKLQKLVCHCVSEIIRNEYNIINWNNIIIKKVPKESHKPSDRPDQVEIGFVSALNALRFYHAPRYFHVQKCIDAYTLHHTLHAHKQSRYGYKCYTKQNKHCVRRIIL